MERFTEKLGWLNYYIHSFLRLKEERKKKIEVSKSSIWETLKKSSEYSFKLTKNKIAFKIT